MALRSLVQAWVEWEELGWRHRPVNDCASLYDTLLKALSAVQQWSSLVTWVSLLAGWVLWGQEGTEWSRQSPPCLAAWHQKETAPPQIACMAAARIKTIAVM